MRDRMEQEQRSQFRAQYDVTVQLLETDIEVLCNEGAKYAPPGSKLQDEVCKPLIRAPLAVELLKQLGGGGHKTAFLARMRLRSMSGEPTAPIRTAVTVRSCQIVSVTRLLL